MIVLSLFDGMSCGQIALKELGIIPETYYASEIDKHAINQTQLNFPNTIQLGSVVDVNVSNLKPIDMLIGGSPCQSFSFAGKRKGMATKCSEEIYTLDKYLQLKADGFEFEGQSYLFWEYMRILTDIRKYNPEVLFLLENVEMGNKWERVLSEAIGVFGVHINSALVSAQNRKRIYWTNIRTRENGLFGELHSDIPQPEDRGILLRDILESEVDEKYYLSDKVVTNLIEHKERHKEQGHGFGAVFNSEDKKMQALKVGGKGIDDLVCVAMRGRNPDNPSDRTTGSPTEQRLEPNLSGKTNCLTSVQKDNLVMQLNPSKESGGLQPYQQNRVYDPNGISPCLNTDSRPHAILELNERQQRNLKSENEKADTFLSTSWKGSQANGMTLIGETRIRRLTPTECARLQTIPEWYKCTCSDTQQYRMLGNGWTVEVIKHIFSFLPDKFLEQ